MFLIPFVKKKMEIIIIIIFFGDFTNEYTSDMALTHDPSLCIPMEGMQMHDGKFILICNTHNHSWFGCTLLSRPGFEPTFCC